MNECLTHRQKYDVTKGGFCPYCGKPGTGATVPAVPQAPIPWIGENVSFKQCPNCGVWMSGKYHVCIHNSASIPRWQTTFTTSGTTNPVSERSRDLDINTLNTQYTAGGKTA